jgi:hypothetical protein
VVGAALPAGQQSGGSKGDFLSEAFVIHGEAAVMGGWPQSGQRKIRCCGGASV